MTPSLPRVLEPPGVNQRVAAWVTLELVVLVPLSALAGGVVLAQAALGPLWLILAALYLLLLTAMAYRRLRGISERAILLAQKARIATGAINAMPDALAVMDARGVYLDANPALCEMTGFAREELLGHAPPYPHWPPESVTQIKHAVAHTADGKQPQWETVFMRKNGDRFPVIVNSTRVLGAEGEVVYYVATFKDVSWVKRAEAALLESEERMRLTMEAAPDAVIVIDDSGIVTEWSGSSEQIFGWNAQEILGLPLAEHIVPHGLRAAHNQGMAHFRQTGQGPVLNKRIELSALHKDGHEFPIELTILPLWLQGKQVFSAFVRDITERERARREIETQQARYRGLYDDNPAMFITLDSNNRIVSINRFGATLLNYEAQDLIGRRLPRLVLKAERRASLQQLDYCRGKPGVTHRWESCLLNSQDDAVWVRIAGRCIERGDESPQLLLVCEDNSEDAVIL